MTHISQQYCAKGGYTVWTNTQFPSWVWSFRWFDQRYLRSGRIFLRIRRLPLFTKGTKTRHAVHLKSSSQNGFSFEYKDLPRRGSNVINTICSLMCVIALDMFSVQEPFIAHASSHGRSKRLPRSLITFELLVLARLPSSNCFIYFVICVMSLNEHQN